MTKKYLLLAVIVLFSLSSLLGGCSGSGRAGMKVEFWGSGNVDLKTPPPLSHVVKGPPVKKVVKVVKKKKKEPAPIKGLMLGLGVMLE